MNAQLCVAAKQELHIKCMRSIFSALKLIPLFELQCDVSSPHLLEDVNAKSLSGVVNKNSDNPIL
jgi:hypothetical protein